MLPEKITMNQRGFSLIELMAVITIMGILLVMATLNFSEWMRKARIEKQTRELLFDLSTARSQSIFKKKRHCITFDASGTGYVFKRYSSENESRTAGGQDLYTKTASNSFAKADGGSLANKIFMFDTRGYAIDTGTIRINPVDSGAAFDCVVIATSRVNIGKMEGASCAQK